MLERYAPERPRFVGMPIGPHPAALIQHTVPIALRMPPSRPAAWLHRDAPLVLNMHERYAPERPRFD